MHADVRIVGPKGSAEIGPPGVLIHEVSTKPLWWFLFSALIKSSILSMRWRPDVVLGGSGLVGPIVFMVAKLRGSLSAVYTHGLDLAIQHRFYRLLWLPFIARANLILVNSQATRKLANSAGAEERQIRLIYPGTNVPPLLSASEIAKKKLIFRREMGVGEGPLLLSVGRLTQRKGLREFVRDVLPIIIGKFPDAIFLIIGEEPRHALHAEAQSRESIQAAADSAGIGLSIRFGGVITDRTALSVAYLAANLHVFPVRDLPGDPEGFGMVAIEAAAHGLATLAYRTGGVADAVADGVSGILIDPRDADSFASAAIALLNQPLDPNGAREHAKQFAWERVGERLAQELLYSQIA